MNDEKLIRGYEIEVEFPDVSGVEHLQMLMIRSELANRDLNSELRHRLLLADKRLLEQTTEFYEAIQKIVDLPQQRQQRNVPITHWWWYLDVIAELTTSFELSVTPVSPNRSPIMETHPATG